MDSRKDFFCDLIFTFLGGPGKPFFVGCDVFQKFQKLRCAMVLNGCDIFQKLQCTMVLNGLDPGVEKKAVSEEVKPIEW